MKAPRLAVEAQTPSSKGASYSGRGHWAAIFLISIAVATTADHVLAWWLDFPQPPPRGFVGAYRRVGPETGPQVFCAGSSLTVAALNWSAISQSLGRGVETWSVAGSSPDIWEQWQQHSPRSTTTIIGVSVYDLNEMHVAPDRSAVVPLSQTLDDLWSSRADSDLSHRILTQYALRYVRALFPTVGSSDKVLVATRAKLTALRGRKDNLAQYEDVVVEPSPPILAAGESASSVNDWSAGRVARRLAVLKAENRGHNEFFHGPKHLAFDRMLLLAKQRGAVIVVVLPVASEYQEAILDDASASLFEKEIQEIKNLVPDAIILRLDRSPGMSAPIYFLDLVHLNSLGRRVATEAFLKEVPRQTLLHRDVPFSGAKVTLSASGR